MARRTALWKGITRRALGAWSGILTRGAPDHRRLFVVEKTARAGARLGG